MSASIPQLTPPEAAPGQASAPRAASRATTRIARSTGVLATAIAVSRVLGFVRDVLLARIFGTTIQAQAFVVAFRLPNVLRDLVAEGAVTSAFVPVLTWYRMKRDEAEFWRLSHALLSRLVVILCGLGALGVLAAPLIVRLVAPGFAGDPAKLALTVALTRILFPFITLVGFWAFFMGLLNSLHHFLMPAMGQAVLNLAMIAACLWVVPRVADGAVAVAVAVMVGGVAQILVQVPVAIRLGFRWRWRWRHPGSKEILRLLGPRVIGSAVYQASVLIDTALASLGTLAGDGAVVALYFANRLVQLPMALFGTASAQASLPALAEQAVHQDHDGFRDTLVSVIRMVAFVILPSAVGLIVMASPIVHGLFERGAFTHAAAVMTSRTLACYALGLWAYSTSKVLTGAFYALRDTRTPVFLAAEALGLNVALSLALLWPLKVSGLALAAALTNTLNAFRLIQRLERRLERPILQPARAALLRMLAASLVMGLACWALWRGVLVRMNPWVGLSLDVAAGVVVYLAASLGFGVQESTTVLRWSNLLPAITQPSASE